ncbi:uncharacterized protein LOC121738527 isoform X2 [Aricia agestis]|nr:uncharacterized protein LOC121738527 isoform X2 [Aricia agestis]
MFQICMVVAFAAAVTAAPVEEPVKIDLPVYERPNDEPSYTLAEQPSDEAGYALAEQPNARPSYTLAEPLQLENHPGENPSSNNLYDNLIGNKIDALDKKLNGPFARIKTLERAVEETEGYGSKILSIKENLGNVAAGIFKPKPIVDIIEEEDKYGNTGDKFYNVGRALVNGSSKVSTYVNTLLEIPGKFVQQISRIASEKLNNVGAKIVGL